MSALAEFHGRIEYIKKFGFAIPNIEALGTIAKYSPILEVGAGAGYWAHQLKEMGVDIIATDIQPDSIKLFGEAHKRQLWTEVEELSAVAAVKKYPGRTLLMIWPSLDEAWPRRCLRAYTGDRLFYVGEGHGGCTADDKFHEILSQQWDLDEEETVCIPRFPSIHDRMYAYKRKGIS